MSVPFLAHGWAISLLVILGLLVLVWGLPRGNRYRLPWRWRVGILCIGLGLIFWPPFYFYFGRVDLEMVWIPIWFATALTFVTGINRLLMANTFEPTRSLRHPYDLGWILRPRPPKPSTSSAEQMLEDDVEDFIEDQSTPLAPLLRRRRWRQRRDPVERGDDSSQ